MENNDITPYFHPKYIYKPDDNIIIICYDSEKGYEYKMDIQDHIDIINCSKKFQIIQGIQYPSYKSNNKLTNILEYIYKFDYTSSNYIFLNGDSNDFRRCNVNIFHEYHNKIIQEYPDAIYIRGHYNNYGVDAFIMKNPMWKIEENNEEIFLMYCEKNTICKLSSYSYQKIIEVEKNDNENEKITWFLCNNGYIAGKIKNKQYYVHQLITGCFGNGKGTSNISVDHIDRDPLNNIMENLRIATREEQEQNSKGIAPNTKRNRQSNARLLPDGITQNMLKKHVVYYYNIYDKKNNKSREYFRVENHPKLDKIWETSKSNSINILEKLQQANKVIEDLENDIYPKNFTETRELPKFVSLIMFRDKPHLYFDKKDESGVRMNLKMVLTENYNLEKELDIFREKICKKYNTDDFVFCV
jgi:hypothetical protein